MEAIGSVPNPNVTLLRKFSLPDPALRITREIRTMCERNLCGNYGKNWGCPPNVPPCGTCEFLLSGYTEVVLVRTTYERRELFDMNEMQSMAKAHNGYSRKIRAELEKNPDIAFKILSAGGCDYCEKCGCPDEKCRAPSERMYSVEAYGIDLTSFLNSYDIKSRAGNREQSFFTMVFCKPAV